MQILTGRSGVQRFIALLLFLFFGAAVALFIPGTLAQRIEMPFAFQVRSLAGLEPVVSDKLIAFALDDRTWDYLGEREPEPVDWDRALQTIFKARPQTVIVNKSFSDHLAALDALNQDRGVQVVLPSLVSQAPRSQRDTLYHGPLLGLQGEHYVQGPMRLVSGNFRVGHANPTRPGEYLPVLTGAEGAVVSVHLGLGGEAGRESEHLNRMLKGGPESGWLPVNALSTEVLSKRILTFKGVLQSARRGLDLGEVIPEGSTVVILSRFATGNLNLIWSPFGNRSANYELLSVVNEGLTGNGTRFSPGLNGVLWAAALFFLFVASVFSQVSVVFFLTVLGPIVLAIVSLTAFLSFSLLSAWAAPAFGLLVGGMYLTIDKALSHYVKSQLLERALVGVVSADQISKIRLDSRVLGVAPAEKNVTILFVDIVGYSVTTEHGDPSRIFSETVRWMERVTEIIHRHGGVVNKNLGDGLFCFFGYDPFTFRSNPDHVNMAFKASLAIQRFALDAIRGMKAHDGFPFPMRIGLNCADVLIGNIGGEERFELTLLGPGVNFAARLEAACEPFCVLIGESAHKVLVEKALDNVFFEKLVKVKHHADLLTCYECNPFLGQEEQIESAFDVFRAFNQIHRMDARHRMRPRDFFLYTSDYGSFELVDFSRQGACVQGQIYFGKGVQLRLWPVVRGSALAEAQIARLVEARVFPLVAEVRWGRANGQAVLQGIRFQGLSAAQLTGLFEFHQHLLEPESPDEPEPEASGMQNPA